MNSTVRATWLATFILTGAGLATPMAAQSASADTPAAEQPPAWCSDNSLLPRTPDAAEAWLRDCPEDGRDHEALPQSADAAEAWLRSVRR